MLSPQNSSWHIKLLPSIAFLPCTEELPGCSEVLMAGATNQAKSCRSTWAEHFLLHRERDSSGLFYFTPVNVLFPPNRTERKKTNRSFKNLGLNGTCLFCDHRAAARCIWLMQKMHIIVCLSCVSCLSYLSYLHDS